MSSEKQTLSNTKHSGFHILNAILGSPALFWVSDFFTLQLMVNFKDIITTCNYYLFCVGMIIAINRQDIKVSTRNAVFCWFLEIKMLRFISAH